MIDRAILLLPVLIVLVIQTDPPKKSRDDFLQPESPARPAPKGLKLVDLGKDEPKLKGYRAPEGFKVEIVAEAPTVLNPVSLSFADDGTLFVLEWRPGEEGRKTSFELKYRDGSKRQFATLSRRGKDAIKALKPNSKGIYEEAQVVLEEELPTSLLMHEGWLYTAGQGSVRRYRPSKPGGAYDQKEVVAQGFSALHPQEVSGLAVGLDGWLYISAGDGDNFVEGSDGSRATVRRTGAVFRCRPDGSKLETFAIGFRNPRGPVAIDPAFNLFHVDDDLEDGSKFAGCRLVHVAETADLGWRRLPGSRLAFDPDRAAVGGELAGTVPPLLKTGRGAPSGLCVYHETFLPESYRGLIYYPDPLRQSVRAYRVERAGASFRVVEEFEFLTARDPRFRPCQMTVGPDGALYLVDSRTDSPDANPLKGDGKQGRIYRISWGGTKELEAIAPRERDSWVKIRKQTNEELLKTLASQNFTDRRAAQAELVKRADGKPTAMLQILEDAEAPSRARLMALGALYSLWNPDVGKALRERLSDPDPDLRRLTIEALGRHGEAKGVEAVSLVEEGEADVRRAAALALARTAAPGVANPLVVALLADDGKDVLLRDGLERSLEALGKTGIEALLDEFESGEKKKILRVVDTFLGTRTRPAADAIPRLLAYPHLTVEQRTALVRSWNNYVLDPPVNLTPLLDYLIRNANEALAVKQAALEVLARNEALGGERAQKWLLGLLEDRNAGVRTATLATLEKTRPSQAAGVLMQFLKSPDIVAKEKETAEKILKELKRQ